MKSLPRGITARRLIRALHEDGFVIKRTRGSHHIYAHSDGRRVVVAYHQMSDSFPVGTLAAIIDDVGWTEDDLKRLGLSG